MFRNMLRSPWLTIISLLAIVLLSGSLIKRYPKFTVANKELTAAAAKLEELSRAPDERIDMSNPAYLERQARLKLNYMKPGEKVVYVYDQANVAPAQSTTRSPAT